MEVIAGIDVGEHLPSGSSSPSYVSPLTYFQPVDGRGRDFTTMSHGGSSYAYTWSSSLADWTRAADYVARALKPADERLLLRDARAALLRGRLRSALFEAVTAAEMALDAVVVERMTAALAGSAAEVAVGRGGVFNVSNRIELATAMGVAIPPGLYNDLFGLRNPAIHRNAPLTAPAVRRAVELAADLVERYVPLP